MKKLIYLIPLACLITACGGRSAQSDHTTESLLEFIGRGSPEAAQKNSIARQTRRENRVAACMKKEGFNYLPFVELGEASFAGPSTKGQANSWKRSHGYGIADSLRNPPLTAVDPNDAIRQNLSTADREVYSRVLSGKDGCVEKTNVQSMQVNRALRTKYIEATARFNSDKQVLEITRNWSRCMSTSGFVVKNEVEIIKKYLAPLEEAIIRQRNEDAETKEDISKPYSETEIAPLRDLACTSPKSVTLLSSIRAKYDSEFIDKNRTLLIEYRKL
jgi:hypothetical protein